MVEGAWKPVQVLAVVAGIVVAQVRTFEIVQVVEDAGSGRCGDG